MKKEYYKPSINIINVRPSMVICGSGNSGTSLRSGTSGNEPEEEDNYGYNGIFTE